MSSALDLHLLVRKNFETPLNRKNIQSQVSIKKVNLDPLKKREEEINRQRHVKNLSSILSQDSCQKIVKTVMQMNDVGKIGKKNRGQLAVKRNQTIVKENRRLLKSIGQIMKGEDFHAPIRKRIMPRPNDEYFHQSICSDDSPDERGSVDSKSKKKYPIMHQSSIQLNKKFEIKRIQSENMKIANAMINIKPNYDFQKYDKHYHENVSKYRKIIQRYDVKTTQPVGDFRNLTSKILSSQNSLNDYDLKLPNIKNQVVVKSRKQNYLTSANPSNRSAMDINNVFDFKN